jgi:hypothetical protein
VAAVVFETVPVDISELNVKVAAGVVDVVPVPFRVMVCGEPLALSATLRFAVKLAAALGEKAMEIVQLEFAARELPQVLVSANALALVPVMPMLAMSSVALPVLVRVAVCAALIDPLAAVKVNGPGGVSEAAGAVTTAAVTVTVFVPLAEVKVAELFASGV